MTGSPRSFDQSEAERGTAVPSAPFRENAGGEVTLRLPASPRAWWAAAPIACILAGVLVIAAERPWLRLRVGDHAVLELAATTWWSSAKVQLGCCLAVLLWLLIGSALSRVPRKHRTGTDSTGVLCFVRARPNAALCGVLLLCSVATAFAVGLAAHRSYPYLSPDTDVVGTVALQLQLMFSVALAVAYLFDMVVIEVPPRGPVVMSGGAAVTECAALDCRRLLVGTAQGAQVLYMAGHSASAKGLLGARAVACLAARLLPATSGAAAPEPLQREVPERSDALEPALPASPGIWCIVGLIGAAVPVLGYSILSAIRGSAAADGVAFSVGAGWLAFWSAGHTLQRWQRRTRRADGRLRLLMFSGVAGRAGAPGIFSGFWLTLLVWGAGGLAMLIVGLGSIFPWHGSAFLPLVIAPLLLLVVVILASPLSGWLLLGAARFALDARVVTADASGVWLGWGRSRVRVTRTESRGAAVILCADGQPNWFRIPSLRKDRAEAGAQARVLASRLSERLIATEDVERQTEKHDEHD